MKEQHATLFSYSFGFALSLLCTGLAYAVATSAHSTSTGALISVIALAFFQLIAQLIFFLHLRKEGVFGLKMIIFFTTIVGMTILVAGSIWIMNHLNYAMSPHDSATFIIHDEGMQK